MDVNPWEFGWTAVAAIATGIAAIATAIAAGATAVYARLVGKQLKDTQTAGQRDRDELATERAIRAIVDSKIRPGSPPTEANVANVKNLYDALEVERQVVSDADLADRMWVTSVFLLWVSWGSRNVSGKGVDYNKLCTETAAIVEACNGCLFAFWRNDEPPQWNWPTDHDAVGLWLTLACAPGAV